MLSKKEHESCTPEEISAQEELYNSLDDKSQLEKFASSDKEQKKNQIWEAINDKIEEIEAGDTAAAEAKPAKYIFYYMVRIAAMLILVAGCYYVFHLNSNKTADTTKYISQINNSSKPKKIILPDNSFVWLDVKASIKYPEHFKDSRSISLLAGKVFFNVAHNAAKPFTVETYKGLKTTVLGTVFVIEKSDNASSVKVSVLKGKVQVSDSATLYATLTGNQGVDVNLTVKMARPLGVDSLELTGWFDSKVVLDHVALKVVAASLYENFGYTINFSSSDLSEKPCSITYNSTDDLDDILLLLDKIYHTTHTYSDSTIYIK